jgi:Large ribosomal RNA subunit accumulation protein YceD
MTSGMVPELHRPIATDWIGRKGFESTVIASSSECEALARRFGIPAIHSLHCRFRLTAAPAASFEAVGHLTARVVQTCVITLVEFEAEVEERFSLRFVPEGTETDNPDPESEDEVPYVGTTLDLGEAAAEQLALALDPYPHKPGAALPEEPAGEAGRPFAALARLRRPY